MESFFERWVCYAKHRIISEHVILTWTKLTVLCDESVHSHAICHETAELMPLKHNVFFCYQQFFILSFSHITQHNIQNITKQNNRHILNISRSNQKGGREGSTIKTQKSLLYIITYIHQKALPSINGRRLGPTNSRRCTFTRHYLQEATDPICFSTHVWCKLVLDYCLLRSCKTSKQHSLLH